MGLLYPGYRDHNRTSVGQDGILRVPSGFTAFQFGYTFGGLISTAFDKANPNINIAIGNMVGATADWAVNLVSNPTGTAYIDLPKDANGDYIFPDVNVVYNDY